MDLPIDLGKVKDTAEKVKKDREEIININVYLDKTCNSDMIGSIKDFLCVTEEGINVKYYDLAEKKLHLDNRPFFAIIFAGKDKYSSLSYEALLSKGVSTAILCIDPNYFVDVAVENDVSIFREDLLCPSYDTYTWITEEGESIIDFNDYNKHMDDSIKDKLINWLYVFSEDKSVSFATKFPFLRSHIANNIISECAIENAAIGAIPILPSADMPLMTLNQVRMLLQLAAIYGYEVNEDRVLDILVIVASAFGLKYVSNSVKNYSPIPGFIVDCGVGLTGTALLGGIAKEYFANGYAIDGLIEKCKTFFKK